MLKLKEKKKKRKKERKNRKKKYQNSLNFESFLQEIVVE